MSGAAAGTADEEPAGRRVVFFAILYRKAVLLLHYPVNTAAGLLTIYSFFAVLFFGGQAAARNVGAAQSLSSTFEGIIVGWFLWTMATTSYNGLSANVTREAQWGTLEQLYMSPYGFGTIMASMVVANLLESFVWGGTMLGLMLVTTNRTLAIDLFTIVPITVLTLASVIGLGFVFAGVTLVYKRIENVTQIMQIVLVGLIAAPVAGLSPLRALPLVQGSAMLQEAMRDGTRLLQFPTADLVILLATAVVYSLLGYAVFVLATRRAREKGVMGHY